MDVFVQYTSKKDGHAVSRVVERAVADAEASGAAVLTLGLLNQASCTLAHEPPLNAHCKPHSFRWRH